MGKISCEACRKTCKGQAIRLQDRYYHVKCFKCRECKKALAAGGFYTHDDVYYCAEDYQRLFGTKCAACDKFVEGEVVTALGSTYHPHCFHCTRCNKDFGAGDKVTFTGKDYLCGTCLDLTQPPSEVTTPATDMGGTGSSPSKKSKGPLITSTPARPEDLADGHLSPMSDMSDLSASEMKENMANGTESESEGRMLLSPHSTTSGYKSDASSERTHDRSSDVFDDFLSSNPFSQKFAQARSDTEGEGDETLEIFEAVPASDVEDTDTGDKRKLSPIQNIMQYRTPSPAASTPSVASKNTRESSLSYNSRFEVDYGKFYNTSYLDKGETAYKKGPSLNPNIAPRQQYHRPENFSYTAVQRDFIRPLRKDGSSMVGTLGETTKYVIKKPAEPVKLNNKEPIELSKFPDAQKHEEAWQQPIERDDWPAPPAPAAAFPEMLREKKHRRGGTRSGYTTAESETETEQEDETDGRPVDPKIQKEIDHLTKLGDSGAAQALIKDLERKRAESPTLDPISASRTPAADREPHYKTRYECPIFASPSRDLDYRPRVYSMDDQLYNKKYRTSTISNLPVPRPGYGLTPRSAMSASSDREAGYFSDTGFVRHALRRERDREERLLSGLSADETTDDEWRRPPVSRDLSAEAPPQQQQQQPAAATNGTASATEILERRSHYSSQSSMEEYDPMTGLRRSKRLGSTISSDAGLLPGYRKTGSSLLKKEEPAKIYPYEQLRLTNNSLPPDAEINSLEKHLSKEDFDSLFHMNREEFYRMAEFKRNDMKKRVGLF